MSLWEQREADAARRVAKLGASAMAGGRSGLPAPMGGVRQGGSRQPTIMVGNAPAVSPLVSGYTMHLARDDAQTFNATGALVSFTSDPGVRAGFVAPTLPATAVTLPFSGVCSVGVTVEFAAGAPEGTTVQVIDAVGTAVVPLPGAGWTAPYKMRQMGGMVPGQVVTTGDTLGVKITAPSGATVDATVYLTVKMEGSASGSPWELVYLTTDWGVAWDGTSWWTTEGSTGDTVTKRNGSGVSQSTFEAGTAGFLRGITWDGVNLWVTGDGVSGGADEERIWEYSTAGSLVSQFATGTAATINRGLAHDGTDLRLSENGATEVETWTEAGVRSSAFAFPTGRTLQGLTWHDGLLWAVDSTSNEIVRLSSAGAVEQAIQGPSGTLTGVEITGGFVYVMNGTGLYRRAL